MTTAPRAGADARTADDPLTLLALGAAAATPAALAHETIGHGSGCLAVDGHVALLTSIWFRCQGATALTDAAGPLGNLALGLAALALLRLRPRPGAFRLFLWLVAMIDLGWFAGQLIHDGALGAGDWAWFGRSLPWPQAWRIAAVLVGIGVYIGAGRPLSRAARSIMAPGDPAGTVFRRIAIAYGAAAVSAAAAGLLWAGDPLGSAVEGLLAVAVAPLPFAFALEAAVKAGPGTDSGGPVARSWAWIGAGAALFLAFALIQGRGLGPLA